LTLPPICFSRNTLLLSQKSLYESQKNIPIQNIRKGMYIQTLHHGLKEVIYVLHTRFQNNPFDTKYCMYELKGHSPSLIVSAQHHILVDTLSPITLKKYKKVGIHPKKIEGKYCLMACMACPSLFEKKRDNEFYDIYHIVLEHNDCPDKQYAIWANGILTESLSEREYLSRSSFQISTIPHTISKIVK
jgi:hypothetical protein